MAARWHISEVDFGPVAALPIFYLTYRLPRGFAYLFAGACAAAFAIADLVSRSGALNGTNLALSALALFAAFSMVAWSSRRFRAYRRSIDSLRSALVQHEKVADSDFVSGVFNRMYFERALLDKLRAGASSFAIVFVDIDDFKGIDDRFGHLMGDGVLRTAAERFAAALGGRGSLARIGGDEFAALVAQPGFDVATIKASHIGRFASRERLEQRLGPFEREDGSRRVDDARRLEYNRPEGHWQRDERRDRAHRPGSPREERYRFRTPRGEGGTRVPARSGKALGAA